jgi:hypothetical protein
VIRWLIALLAALRTPTLGKPKAEGALSRINNIAAAFNLLEHTNGGFQRQYAGKLTAAKVVRFGHSAPLHSLCFGNVAGLS